MAREPRYNMETHDLQRLIQIITEEVVAAVSQGGDSAQCRCHSVLYGVLPQPPAGRARRRRVAARPARLGRTGRQRGDAHRPHAAQGRRDAGGHRAHLPRGAGLGFATVCVNPTWVALAAKLLRGAPVAVCSVVGFPLGATTPDVKHYETRRAIFDGASEIDMVINIGALKSGDLAYGSTGHRGRGGAVPGAQRPDEGHHRGRAPHRRREDHGLHASPRRPAPTT